MGTTRGRRRDGASGLGVAMVGLLAAPLLLGLATACSRRTRVWVVATLGAALALFAVLLIAT